MVFNASTCPISFLVHAVSAGPNATGAQEVAKEIDSNLATSVALAVTLLCISVFILFCGNKLVRPTLFLTSFLFVGAVTLALMPSIVDSVSSMSEITSCYTVGLVPLALGVMAGCISLCILSFGMWLLGVGAGAGTGYAAYIGVLHLWPLAAVGSSDLMLILCVAIGGLAGGAVMLRSQKYVFIVATSAMGAFGATAAGAMLLAHVDARFIGSLRLNVDLDGDSYSFVWPQALAILLLFLLGVYAQCKQDSRYKERKAQDSALNHARVPLVVVP